jgi:membrane fusion protein (multidrug efflux system)
MEPLRVGQKVDISVDAFSDSTFHGEIESFSGATGAKFSLLPPDNATGNFVKVVQRVPVRIKIDADSSLVKLLRAGMSADIVVHTK